MRKTIVLFVYIALFSSLSSQIAPVISTSTSIANTSVADSKHWQAFNNPAMIGNVENMQIGLQYENRFLLSELSTKCTQFVLPTSVVNTGISFSYFGYSQYHEMLVGLGFARNFSDKFSMGVQFNYYTAFFYSSNSYHGVLLPQIGLNVKLTNNFNLGFSSFNPFQSNITTDLIVKRLPSVFSLGTEYNFSPDFIWRTQIDNEISSNYRFATGFEYLMLKNFGVKLGAYGYDYLVPCLGIGIYSKSLQFNLNCELHPLLGLNTIAGISYNFNK